MVRTINVTADIELLVCSFENHSVQFFDLLDMSLVHALEVREEVEIKPKKVVTKPKQNAEDSVISERDFSSGDEEKDRVEALSQQTFSSIKKLNLTTGRSGSSRN